MPSDPSQPTTPKPHFSHIRVSMSAPQIRILPYPLSRRPDCHTPQPHINFSVVSNKKLVRPSTPPATDDEILKQTVPTKLNQIPVVSVNDNNSRERLRLKIAESQQQARLKFNWSALQAQ